MKMLDVIAAVLLVVGGANWGLVGLFNFDLVATIFGAGSILANVVYVVVGLAAAYQAVSVAGIRRRWSFYTPRVATA